MVRMTREWSTELNGEWRLFAVPDTGEVQAEDLCIIGFVVRHGARFEAQDGKRKQIDIFESLTLAMEATEREV